MHTRNTVDLTLLPYGNPSFSSLREKNMIYVDKTGLLGNMAKQQAPIFFSRPRRFGKSLLVNTISSLFSNGLDYFHGLDIEKMWKDKIYQVVRLDFSGMAAKNPQVLKQDLGETIIRRFKMEGSVSQQGTFGVKSPDRVLDEICSTLQNNSVVLLIDEYDAPLTHHIDAHDELQEIQSILSDFYSTIK